MMTLHICSLIRLYTTEPTPDLITLTFAIITILLIIGGVYIRQGGACISILILHLDGIRIGTAWAEVVPVELTSFTSAVDGNNVILSWSTASELNNQGFEIQRSTQGNEFASIGFVAGHGTTTEAKNL